ncbi:Aspyridones efflux protein [Cladobotryum mycophilum]|uniref:Aspyridones efflux protein n=1 Tax=Cladobotryum mycophilum TaxID=491253 RepID=A0ABR0SB35_9HYPO
MEDVATTTAILSFAQTIGGALFISVAQTAFSNELVQELKVRAPDLNSSTVLDAGAADLASHVPKQYLSEVVVSYSNGLAKSFIVGTVLVVLSLTGSVFVEWRSVKSRKNEADGKGVWEGNRTEVVIMG